jgi:hypothetical protein
LTTLQYISAAAAVILPLFNIPLIVRIQQRRSSQDVSLTWAVGVWACFVIMLPSGLTSPDKVYRIFSVANITLFTGVLVQVLRFRNRSAAGTTDPR